MKKRLLAVLISVCVALSGCASYNTNTDTGAAAPPAGQNNGNAADGGNNNSANSNAGSAAGQVKEAVYNDVPQNEAEGYNDIQYGITGAAAVADSAYGIAAKNASGEKYIPIDENRDKNASEENTLTFSLKVDTAAYTNTQRYVESGQLPPADAVRIEELINYFSYDTKVPLEKGSPFEIYAEIGKSPYDSGKNLAFVRVKAKDIDRAELPRSNFVFLIDTSGSMNESDKLPLLQRSFRLFARNLTENDRVSIVTYAGSDTVVLDSVSGDNLKAIESALDGLYSEGSTAGAQGIVSAYNLAEKNFINGGNNRVILATDGDFNVGVSSIEGLEKLISEKRESGVYLSILGFGSGNLGDATMETLSKNGNGNYSYIDSLDTAKKVLVDEYGTTFAIADDVKAQLVWNTDLVKSYRLIGYENRVMTNEDFDDDRKDAGEIGAGNDVIVICEFEPRETSSVQHNESLFTVRIRYKNPGDSDSRLVEKPVAPVLPVTNSSDFNFAAAVAGYGHLLRQSDKMGAVTADKVYDLASANLGTDFAGYRHGFLKLIDRLRYSDYGVND